MLLICATEAKEPTKHQYDFDTATVLGFLRKYGLEKDFKMNIEANHATLAQHTFQHELRTARDNGVFGSIDANQGDTQSAGLSLRWFRDNFCSAEKETAKLTDMDEYTVMNSEAEKVPIGSNGLIYLPYLMGERTPHLDPYARGVFFGLSASHTKRDMLRSVMEGVSYSLKDCIQVFREMNINISDMAVCGGGGNSPLWRSMLADLYGCPVKTMSSKEGPALGAALLAFVGAGVYSSVEEACEAVTANESVTRPNAENSKKYEKYYRIYQSLYPALKEQYKELSDILYK